MSYKEKFKASQEHAHSQVIATKILKELDDLRSKVGNSKTAPRRWVWELLQNAKDVSPMGGVKIRIEFEPQGTKPHVTFSHNGEPFTANDIRFLIEQISTKDRSKNEEGKRTKTGKFGTGFLTTHLLSETVTITGVAKEPDLDYRQFKLVLDRSSGDIDGITAAVQIAKSSVETLDATPAYSGYKEGAFNTAFRYSLEDQTSRDVAQAGIKDLSNCLPYALLFVHEVDSVEVLSAKRFFREPTSTRSLGDGVSLTSVTTEDSGRRIPFTIAELSKGLTSIAVPVKIEDGSTSLLAIGDVPRLFCDFPLIGTEQFPFPVIINNPNFNPTDPRDGVFLTSPQRVHAPIEENKSIMREAVVLYLRLLQHATQNRWKNLHLLAQIPAGGSWDWLDRAWLAREVSDPIRKELLRAKIVETANGELASMLSADGKPFLWFPSAATREVREKIWHCASTWFPDRLPKASDIELWHKLSWNECGKLTVGQLATLVENKKTVADLQADLGPRRGAYEWLNEFYALLGEEEVHYDTIINKHEIFPNQNGDFRRKSQLHEDAADIGDEFKDILKLLKRDVRDELVADDIEEDFETTRDRTFAVKEITSEVNEKANDREVARRFSAAFKKLLLYFRREPVEAQKLFPSLYQRKHLLYDDEEILDNLDKAEKLTELLNEFNAKDIAALRDLIARGTNMKDTLLPVTQEILVSMGITSPAEWAEALKDKDLAALFAHKSTPSRDMFVYAQGLIEKAKRNVIAHLQTLPQYDLSRMDETAPTVLAGVLKDNQSMNVVVRPSHGGYVFIYYGSELDVLDYETSELWVDDGTTTPSRITLGHILRKAEIKKFPI